MVPTLCPPGPGRTPCKRHLPREDKGPKQSRQVPGREALPSATMKGLPTEHGLFWKRKRWEVTLHVFKERQPWLKRRGSHRGGPRALATTPDPSRGVERRQGQEGRGQHRRLPQKAQPGR